jgi:hypothetical protein
VRGQKHEVKQQQQQQGLMQFVKKGKSKAKTHAESLPHPFSLIHL